ncbi:MAG TPA: ABC transporter ATP-binding protein [candidate division Zixibacteria bacterium]|nr:ABC transporter ATP-binding protein [candidate division Zixibacteria bacterium]
MKEMVDSTEQPGERSSANLTPVIQFDGVSKRFNYNIQQQRTVLESIISIFSRDRRGNTVLWAVRDVSFQVSAGECLGIVGRNGSGKSTVLKLIAGIIRPTEGQISVNGRLSALLELGAGFHQELTGRENIYLNGSILGMSKEEIEACYDDIVDFSELAEFIDMPVKHYSSGMYMRLGFSVAVHVDPKLLIVDEVLAVGDQTFQDKCIERIFELKRAGTTIIIVSHNLDTVRRLSTRLLWLERGIENASGPVEQVISQYLEHLHHSEMPVVQAGLEGNFRRWGTGDIEITKVRILDSESQEQDVFQIGSELTVEISYFARKVIAEPEFGIAIFRQDGVQVNGPNNRMAGYKIDSVEGAGIVRYRVESLPLLSAAYRITVAIHDGRVPRAFDFHEQAYPFRVVDPSSRHQSGLIDLPASWDWLISETASEQGEELVEVAE